MWLVDTCNGVGGRDPQLRCALLKVGSKMIIGFLGGAMLYGSVTLVFLIFLTANLVDDFQDTHIRLAKVFFVSVFWPVSLLVITARVVPSRLAAVSRAFSSRPNGNVSRPLRVRTQPVSPT